MAGPESARLPALLLGLALLLAGCVRAPETGPGEIRWDRNICARCSMVVSDRLHAAQVRGGGAENPGKLYYFDDLGCAVVWLKKQPWAEDARTEIWVASSDDGQWIDARSASYATGVQSPMDYGLGARAASGEGLVSFEEACQRVQQVEERHERERGQRATPRGLGQ